MKTAILLASLTLATPALAQPTPAEQAPARENAPTLSAPERPVANATSKVTETQPAEPKKADSHLLRDLRVYPCF